MGALDDTTRELVKDKGVNENANVMVHENNLLKRSGSKRNATAMDENALKAEAASFSSRQYTRSKTPRLRWTPDLHLRFLQVIERLGGQERATPKLVLQLMNIKGLSIGHVKSHLQMFRSQKTHCFNGVAKQLLDNALQYYNLKNLPLKQNFTKNVSSNLRDGDPSWINHLQQLSSCNKVKAAAMNFIRGGLINRCNLLKERKFRSKSNYIAGFEKFLKHCVPDSQSNSQNLKAPQDNPRLTRGYHQIKQPEEGGSAIQNFQTIQELEQDSTDDDEDDDKDNQNSLKRKVLDEYLDLNLSLRFAAKHGAEDNAEQSEESCLSLSLSSAPVSGFVRSEERGGILKKGKTEHTDNLDLNL